MTRRTLGSVVVLVFILVLPYWVYLPSLFIAIIFFPFYWEGLLLSFLIDAIYGSEIKIALYTLVTLIILLPFRENLRAYV